MGNERRFRPGSAHLLAGIALFVALGGVAVALQANSVKSRHIKNDQVRFADLQGVKAWNKVVGITGSEPDSGDAREEANPVVLAKRGTITIYGKCFENTTTDNVFGLAFARTSANGAVLETATGGDLLGSPDYLDRNTDEPFRGLGASAFAGVDQAGFIQHEEGAAFSIVTARHKLHLSGQISIGAKQGSPVNGNGPYGAGKRCAFGGHVIG
jgi:hypothetical protein